MPDARQPDETDGEPTGRVDYSNRDYSAPTGYRAPDFLSSWSRPATEAGATPDTDDGADVDARVHDGRSDHERDAPDGDAPAADTAGSDTAGSDAPDPVAAPGEAEPDSPLGHWGAASSGDAVTTEGAIDRDGHSPADVGGAVPPAAAEGPEGHRDAPAGRDTDTELASSGSDDHDDDHGWDDERDGNHDSSASSDAPAWTPRSDPPEQAEQAEPAEQPGTPRDHSILAMFFGLAALFTALISPLFLWAFVTLTAVFALPPFRHGGARRIRALIAGGLALVGVILFVATSLTVPTGSGVADDTLDPAATSANGEPFVIDGSGDADVRFPMPDGPGSLAVVDITYEGPSGSLFADELVDDGYGTSVASIYRSGTARGIVNGSSSGEALGLEIEAEGDWSIRVSSVTSLPTFDTTVSGEGDAFLYYDGPAGVSTFTFEKPVYVNVELLGTEDSWSVYGSDFLVFSKLWPAGPLVVSIESDEAWTLDILPGATTAPGVDPAATPDGVESPSTEPDATDGAPAPEGTAPAEQLGEDGATEG